MALGGSFYYPLVKEIENPIEYSFLADHTITVQYEALKNGIHCRNNDIFVKEKEEVKFTKNSAVLKELKISPLEGHDIIIKCDDDIVCVLQCKKNDMLSSGEWESMLVILWLDLNGTLKLDGKFVRFH